jgi:toxin-antitoxin system PIN domain toxin
LLDANVLVYAVDAEAPLHAACHEVVSRSMLGQLNAALVPQVLMEFYAVVTSSRRVRSPLSVRDATAQVTDWRASIPVRYPTARCLEEWTVMVQKLQRTGQEVHDLFLAAQMRAHDIGDICTANPGDFAGISGITVHHPTRLLEQEEE